MLSRKDLNSAELETVRVSKSPTTVVAASGQVRTNDEATVYVKNCLFVTVMFLEDTPTVLSHLKLCVKITDTHASGPVVGNHISLEMADEYNAARKTTYRSLSPCLSTVSCSALRIGTKVLQCIISDLGN